MQINKNNKKIRMCPLCGGKKVDKSLANPLDMRRKAAKSLTNHLIFVLGIKPGNELVFILGSGTEKDNHAAVRSWVMNRIADVESWPMTSTDVSDLVNLLEHDLSEILHDLQLCAHV